MRVADPISGVKFHQELLDLTWTLTGNELVRRTVRYLKKKFPTKQGPAEMPITVRVLTQILPLLEGPGMGFSGSGFHAEG
jgi:hypothetical protein